MWPDGEVDPRVTNADSGAGRASTGSEVVILDDRTMSAATASSPNIAQLNVTKSSRLHFGPKFVSVNQTVHNTEVVKGRLLGLELVTPKSSPRLRCSIIVFVCWAVVVASGIAFYLITYALLQQRQSRLDLDLPFPSYLCNFIKSTTRAERLSCLAATIFLGVCITLIIVYSVNKDQLLPDADESVVSKKGTLGAVLQLRVTSEGTRFARTIDGPDTWNITRMMWLAKAWETKELTAPFEPLRLVVIQHTVSSECRRFMDCAAELRTIQEYFLKQFEYDLPYNFMIGNEGRVYEARGWGKVGAHTRYYNRCALGLGFIGDYREELPGHSSVTSLQIFRTKMLLNYGVQMGYLHPDYHVVAAKDVQITASPGSNLYNEMKTWDHYNDGHKYRNKTCEEIYADIKAKDG